MRIPILTLPRGPWTSGDLSARNYYSLGRYEITTPKGRVIPGTLKEMNWRFSKDRFAELDKDRRIWRGKDGDNQPRLKRFLMARGAVSDGHAAGRTEGEAAAVAWAVDAMLRGVVDSDADTDDD